MAFHPKQLLKGGKPAQGASPVKAALDENKAWLRNLFSSESEPVVGARVTSMSMVHAKSQASAGLSGGGRGYGIVNVSMSYGTDTDHIIETDIGGETVVPKRFLNQRGDIHQELFKVGDVVITTVGSCEKTVNIGSRTGAMAVGGRGFHEVCAWIPADKVERALKEGRLIMASALRSEVLAKQAAAAAAAAAVQVELMAKLTAEVAERAAVTASELVDGEDLGSW
jgi:hypothetical protein